MTPLHVFEFSDCDLVVAADVADAWTALFEQTGECRDNYDETDDALWRQWPDEEELGMWCDEDGDIAQIDQDGADVVTRTAGEWAKRLGVGWFGSTEG